LNWPSIVSKCKENWLNVWIYSSSLPILIGILKKQGAMSVEKGLKELDCPQKNTATTG
jgi:hypothetical protein